MVTELEELHKERAALAMMPAISPGRPRGGIGVLEGRIGRPARRTRSA